MHQTTRAVLFCTNLDVLSNNYVNDFQPLYLHEFEYSNENTIHIFLLMCINYFQSFQKDRTY